MEKKFVSMVLAALMLLVSLAFAEGTAHTHTFSEEWDRDLQKHWHACECGEKFEEEDHVIGEEQIQCEICGSEVWIYGEEAGPGDICDYDENGNVIRNTSYDENGEMIDDYRYLLQYDADGNRIHEEVYWNGQLIEVVEYALSKNGEVVMKNRLGYDPEGGSSIVEFDEYGSCVHTVTYDADGAVIYENFAEYTYDEEGWILYTKESVYFDGVLSAEHEYNQYNDEVLDVFYNEDGSVSFGSRTEYEYDERGNRLSMKVYDVVTGRLTRESAYAVKKIDGWEENYEATEICYEEDGSKYVYEYDERGNELTETVYNAEGKIEVVYRSEYEFDDEGNVLLHDRYENERLHLVVQYDVIETEEWSCHYEKIRTEIYEDGSMYICEYDEEGNEVSAGLFDQDGNPLPEEESAEK